MAAIVQGRSAIGVLCHTPPGADGPFDMSRAYQGDRELPDFGKPGRKRSVATSPLAPNAVSVIGAIDRSNARSQSGFARTGRSWPARCRSTAKITPADVDAIDAHLRLPPPTKTP
jgi:hypothetical protein